MNTRTRFYLPVWNVRPLNEFRRTAFLSVRYAGNRYFPRGGAWVGVLPDGSETVDFGLRSEAEACARYFASIARRCEVCRVQSETRHARVHT